MLTVFEPGTTEGNRGVPHRCALGNVMQPSPCPRALLPGGCAKMSSGARFDWPSSWPATVILTVWFIPRPYRRLTGQMTVCRGR